MFSTGCGRNSSIPHARLTVFVHVAPWFARWFLVGWLLLLLQQLCLMCRLSCAAVGSDAAVMSSSLHQKEA